LLRLRASHKVVLNPPVGPLAQRVVLPLPPLQWRMKP